VNERAATVALVNEASEPYLSANRYAYYRARGKLRGDPAFTAILAQGWLSGSERILDLGCGEGLLAAWLLAARTRHAVQEGHSESWPQTWPAAPQPTSIRGIELNEHAVRRARNALGEQADFRVGDITEAEFGLTDAIVILDVLHYIDYRSQLRVLERAHASLAAGGVLLLRVSDAEAGIRFSIGKYLDQTLLLTREHRSPRLYCRSVREWRHVLATGGFKTDFLPMSSGTPFANFMLIARRA
jgi:SAM-dependent methyltransferase